MKFTAALFSVVLLLETVAATSIRTSRRHRTRKHGFSRSRRASPRSLTHRSPSLQSRASFQSGTYSPGPYLEAGAHHTGSEIDTISTSFTVPIVNACNSGAYSPQDSGPTNSGYSDSYTGLGQLTGGTAVVGIGEAEAGSESSQNARFQAGIAWVGTVSSSGANCPTAPTNYSAFYEWLPSPMGFFALDVSQGDVINIRLEMAGSNQSGVAYASNQNTDQTASQTLTGPAVVATAAGWSMGTMAKNGNYLEPAFFSNAHFAACSGTEATGSTFDLAGAAFTNGGSGCDYWTQCNTVKGSASADMRCSFAGSSTCASS